MSGPTTLLSAAEEIERFVLNNGNLGTQEQSALNEIAAGLKLAWLQDRDPYLIWSNEHRAWWRANRAGYAIDIEAAGLYSRGEACLIAENARDGWRPGSPPPEIAVRLADMPPSARQAVHNRPR